MEHRDRSIPGVYQRLRFSTMQRARRMKELKCSASSISFLVQQARNFNRMLVQANRRSGNGDSSVQR